VSSPILSLERFGLDEEEGDLVCEGARREELLGGLGGKAKDCDKGEGEVKLACEGVWGLAFGFGE
jgi:hypothetical protein